MKDIDRIVKGYQILSAYDNTNGNISCGGNSWLFAGPEDVEVPVDAAQRLTMLGWQFNSGIGRWGIDL